MDITFDRKTVGTCLQQRFTLPTYQREYRWETKHLQELLTDIQEEFLQNYEPTHGRSAVGDYNPYFLGTIITTSGSAGTRSIVDGQQRITTLIIILAYFFRESRLDENLKISNIAPLLRRDVYGESQFNIDFDEDRRELFKILLDRTDLNGQDLDEAVDAIPNITPSTREVYSIFTQVETFILDSIKTTVIPNFIDYVTERVYLFEIGVPSEQDGHKVFVTMNDRGLKLAPIDLLKGYLLSNIKDPKSNSAASQKWSDCIRDLRSLGRDEESTFFKTWLRAQYAQTSRGKSKGDAPGDFEIVGDAYHRWVVDNTDALRLNNSDDYYDMVNRTIPFYLAHYRRIKEAEATYSSEFPHVYYNGVKNLTLQYMAILSAIDVNDTSVVVDKKIKIISYYLDYFASARVVSHRDNNYDNIKDYVFSFSRKIRRKSVADIVLEIETEIDGNDSNFDLLEQVRYNSIKRQDMLHLLARFASYLEDALDLTNKVGFDGYVDRSRGNKTFDVEHLLPAPWSTAPEDWETDDTASGISVGTSIVPAKLTLRIALRDRIGALALLPRGRNRSLQDMRYSEKLSRYATENVLTQSLTPEFYMNHPNISTFTTMSGISLEPIPQFTEIAFEKRNALFLAIADKLWSKATLRSLAAT